MTHPTHKTRYSDSSLYDEKCVRCGATDASGDRRLEEPCPKTTEEADVNDQNLRKVIENLDENLSTYAPGGGAQLVPARPLSAKAQAIIDDAEKLCRDTLAAYQQQVDVATAKRDAAKAFCDRMMNAATKTAAELSEDAAQQTTLIEEMDAAIAKYERSRIREEVSEPPIEEREDDHNAGAVGPIKR